MVIFSNDADILKYEPILFGELHLPWQVLAAGTGASLSGTTLTASGADFIAAQVRAGGVAYLQSADGSLDGAYEIVSVDSSTQLSISVVRADSADTAVPPPAATNISYRISTFGPQAAEVGFQLTEYFGIRPGNPASDIDADDIQDTTVLRLASVFAVISSVYAMLAGKTKEPNYWNKSMYYQKLSAKARGRCRLSIDAGTDGLADVTKIGAAGRLVRD
ncbi:MAG: hypothetical protein JXA81_05080 [Sedimentisphaerales bacterium]|nr:hypothetical protein [Sedimentisphaerales bacterium]